MCYIISSEHLKTRRLCINFLALERSCRTKRDSFFQTLINKNNWVELSIRDQFWHKHHPFRSKIVILRHHLWRTCVFFFLDFTVGSTMNILYWCSDYPFSFPHDLSKVPFMYHLGGYKRARPTNRLLQSPSGDVTSETSIAIT